MPCCSTLLCCLVVHHHADDALLQGCSPSLPCCSHLVTLPLIAAPCYSHYRTLLFYHHTLLLCLTTLPSCLMLTPYYSTLFLAFFLYLLPHPHCCFITLLLAFMPCCSTLLVGAPSPLSCARAWNNNKFHPTT